MVIRHVADNSDLVKSKKLNFYFQRKSRSVEFLGSFPFWRQLLHSETHISPKFTWNVVSQQ